MPPTRCSWTFAGACDRAIDSPDRGCAKSAMAAPQGYSFLAEGRYPLCARAAPAPRSLRLTPPRRPCLSAVTVQCAATLTNFFLLGFFTTVGLSAKLSALQAGGRPLVILGVVTVMLLVTQNLVGIVVATLTGAHPFYGLLIGSISFV